MLLASQIADTAVTTPTGEQLLRVLTLQDYNTRVVVLGTMLLGVAAGVIGTFMLLRKRALMGDALSHATLPGIGIAFIVMSAAGGSGKYLPGLLAGALVSGVTGMACVLLIRHWTRLKEDAALGIVLSVFFGLGIAVLGVIQKMTTGNAAGLESFIYGKTASMLASDAMMIAGVALMVIVACTLLFKEFGLLCFDQAYAGAQGWPVVVLDTIMMALVVAVTVIGLQAVGLILIIALLIIPAAAARFWTDRLPQMVATAAGIGAVSGLVGAALSALVPRMPAGAIIVVVAATIFLVSMVFGSARGVLRRLIEHVRLSRKVARQHLLRALFEWHEESPATDMPWNALLAERSWSAASLRRLLAAARREALVESAYRLSGAGRVEAQRVVRNHRLWELFLIHYADIAPSHVDRDADRIEHVLDPVIIGELETLLAADEAHLDVPPSPHLLKVKNP